MPIFDTLYSLWPSSTTKNSPTADEKYHQATLEKDALLERIKQLKEKHQTFLNNAALTTESRTISINKIKMLTLCSNFINNEKIDVNDIKHEKIQQANLPLNYTTYSGWWPTLGLGYFWQDVQSATDLVVEDTLTWAENAPIAYEQAGYAFGLR